MSKLGFLKNLWYHSGSERYIKQLRKGGVKIGKNCIIRGAHTARIDVSRPSLVSIGDNVDMNMYFQILTHDWACSVFRNKYHDFVNSSGKVTIGSNIYFGTNVTVLKGVTIGDNCVIGANSLVTHDIPANSVAAGTPCRVLCTLDAYYEKRKAQGLEEAKEYVRSIRDRFHREAKVEEMKEEFIYFMDAHNVNDYPTLPPAWIKFQLGEGYEEWLKNHKAPYRSFQDFLNGIE